ncbi:MAG: S8 family serine peptidase [Acholeplasmataceae bacterium]|nr:S8 family serine peptidase [Acholeplasmataceae bacterium]
MNIYAKKILLLLMVLFASLILYSRVLYAYDATSVNILKNKTPIDTFIIIDKMSDKDTIEFYIWLDDTDKNSKIDLGLNELGYFRNSNEDCYIINHPNDDSILQYDSIQSFKNYKNDRKNILKNIILDFNNEFISNYNIDASDVVYNSPNTNMIILKLNKSKLLNLISDERVIDINIFYNRKFEKATNIIPNQINGGIGTTSNPGLKNPLLGGCDGSGVTIGIIEAEGQRYHTLTPSLITPHSTGQLSYLHVMSSNPGMDHHASLVTSIIVGTATMYSNNTFEGIATGSTVYQTSIVNELELYLAFDVLDENGVDIINMSISNYEFGNDYSDIDRIIDDKIYNTKIVTVVAAGNSGSSIGSPGKAYNAITVGNVDTKSHWFKSKQKPYGVHLSSSNTVRSFLSNKPEVSAPGTMVSYLNNSNNLVSDIGTSYSAPFVTGIIALLMEKYRLNVDFQNYITYFKARIMIGAQSEYVTDGTHRHGDSLYFYNRHGIGMVNAVNSAQNIYGFSLYMAISLLNSSYSHLIPPSEIDTKIRAVLVFEKPENIMITQAYKNNFDIELLNFGDYNLLTSSKSTTNVHENIKYTIQSGNTSMLRVSRTNYIPSTKYISISLYWMEGV